VNPGTAFSLVFPHAAYEVAGHADVQRPVLAAGEKVDVIRHGGAMLVRIVLLIGFLITTVAPFFGPTYIQSQAMAFDPNSLGSGPTNLGAGLLIVPWLVAAFYLISLTLIFGWPSRRLGMGRLRFGELVQRLSAGRVGFVTSFVMVSTSLAVCYGISAYWFATTEGLTIRRGWAAATITHPWSEVTKRFIGCVPRKLDYVIAFTVTTADGSLVNLANARQTDFARHFYQLIHLTDNAVTKLGDVEHCPPAYRDALRYISSAR
jgi:hypothetical protein